MLSDLKRCSKIGKVLAPALLSGLLLSACGAAAASSINPKAQGVLLRASRSTQREKSFAISGDEVVSSSDGDTTVKESGYVYEIGPGSANVRAQLTSRSYSSSSHSIITSTELVIGNDVYAGIPSNEAGFTTLHGARWIGSKTPNSSATLGDVLGRVDSTDPAAALATVARGTNAAVSDVGHGIIDGHQATEYSASMAPVSFFEDAASSDKGDALKKELAELNFNGPIKALFWIGTDGLLRQELVKFDFTAQEQGSSTSTSVGITLKVNVSHYGTTFPVLSAPASGVISTSTYESDIEAESAKGN